MPPNLANPAIKHVFVLMLENRAFDHMLGFLNNDISQYSNSYAYGTPPVNHIYPATKHADYKMTYDPGHEFPDALIQLGGKDAVYPKKGPYPAIDNSGFVYDYANTKSKDEGGAKSNFGEIMKCYDTINQLPVLAALVNNFTLCDNWFSSLPGPTWPNRFFVHAASSAGFCSSPTMGEMIKWETYHGFSFPHGTIYNRFDSHNKTYRLYRGVSWPLEGAIPGVAALKGIHLRDTHDYAKFESDINGPYPYDYTFIEPNYGDIINSSYKGGQSQHPMDDVRGGEALIKSTYEALRNSPLWKNSLLIITYDEHGGFYDHVKPPVAMNPGDTAPDVPYNKFQFMFDQYGVRVPAIVISGYTAHTIDHTLFDHSSVPATLEAMYGMLSLTKRDANANNVTGLAALPSLRDTPTKLPPVAKLSPQEEAALLNTPPPLNEAITPVDGGNLPAFLQVVVKADLEREPTKTAVMQAPLIAEFMAIQTRAHARAYIERKLPGLLSE